MVKKREVLWEILSLRFGAIIFYYRFGMQQDSLMGE
jgi:hypothetical protein